ncbi:hypothetical protein Q8A73_012664 [Channa argus]|nr:hypothetical protein Q8A73_012664 [Channa argus]
MNMLLLLVVQLHLSYSLKDDAGFPQVFPNRQQHFEHGTINVSCEGLNGLKALPAAQHKCQCFVGVFAGVDGTTSMQEEPYDHQRCSNISFLFSTPFFFNNSELLYKVLRLYEFSVSGQASVAGTQQATYALVMKPRKEEGNSVDTVQEHSATQQPQVPLWVLNYYYHDKIPSTVQLIRQNLVGRHYRPPTTGRADSVMQELLMR